MKISRIIFISYFSLIGLFLIGFTIMGFAYNDKSSDEFKRDHYEEVSGDLQSYHHIYVDKDCKVNINSSDRSYFSYAVKKEENQGKPFFEIRNDTLFVQHTKRFITIYSDQLNSVCGQECNVTFGKVNLSSLFVRIRKGRVRFLKDVTISELSLSLIESRLGAGDLKTKLLNLEVDNSEVNVHCNRKFEEVKGTIRNNSTIRINAAKSIQLDLDESSHLQIH